MDDAHGDALYTDPSRHLTWIVDYIIERGVGVRKVE